MNRWLDRTQAWIHHHTRPAGAEGDALPAAPSDEQIRMQWKAQSLAALDPDAVWGIYTDWVYGVVEKHVLDGDDLTLVEGQYTSDGQQRQVPTIADPIPLLLARLWEAGQRYGALMLITGLWVRVRQKQQERNQIPWPADDLLDGLRFYLRGTSWTNEDHREFSQMFWKRIAEPAIGHNLAQLLKQPEPDTPA
jgi:hypothetical protein